MPSARHAPSSSTSSLASLPPRFTVPPLPPRIHRRLLLTRHTHGLLIRPKLLSDSSTSPNLPFLGSGLGSALRSGSTSNLNFDSNSKSSPSVLGTGQAATSSYPTVTGPHPASPGLDTTSTTGSVLVRWGVRGKVEHWHDGNVAAQDEHGPLAGTTAGGAGIEVEIGGIVGIVRLWDAAYLLVFLPSTKPPSTLFRNHIDPFHAEPSREAGPSAHEVYTLSDVHSIPLVPELAQAALKRLAAIQAKRAPKRAIHHTPSKTRLNLKWSLPWSGTDSSSVSADERRALEMSSDDDDKSTDADPDDPDDDEADSENDPNKTLQPLPPPPPPQQQQLEEADDARASLESARSVDDFKSPTLKTNDSPHSRTKKRSSMGWTRFRLPKLGAGNKQVNPGQLWMNNGDNQSANIPLAASSIEQVRAAERDSLFPPEQEADDDFNPSSTSTDPLRTGNNSPNPSNTTTAFVGTAPQRRELETKILRQITREFSTGGFFYSFDFDLTHSLQHKRRIVTSRTASGPLLDDLLTGEKEEEERKSFFPPSSEEEKDKKKAFQQPSSLGSAFEPHQPGGAAGGDDFIEPDIQIPLWRRVDRRFFWNEWMLKDFIDSGLHAFVLPQMQGWVQSSTFTVPVPPNPLEPDVSLGSVPIDLVVISRRSRDRAGLRYQRRGIDDEGHVANMCETEMIVRAKVEGKTSLFCFVQVRGSIPLKWSQSPYSMKPPPILDQPVEQSYSIANLHFDDLVHKYGPITIINLSEQTGKEAVVTNGYKMLVDSLGRNDIKYRGFDFHAKCHGMKWENISELVNDLDFGSMGYYWTLQGDVIREQIGSFRTKTNVVQSAIARHVLGAMLTQLGLVLDPATSDVETVFNDIWANNGDMLSFCYAHTSALKGDFVRTGKRDFQGMLHDGVSSISRMFHGAVSDFFAQAVISFFLGQRNLGVFSEFLETLQSTDASSLIKLSRVRAAAIETSSARVLSDGEHRIAGWTLLSPADRNVKLSLKLEEKVLLLTKLALYVVSFNYSLEKVIGFTRIPLASITSIEKGAYILSPLQEAGRDPAENAGFLIRFSPANESTRYSTYSIRNKSPASSSKAKSESLTTGKTLSPTSLQSPESNPSTPGTPDTPPAHVAFATVDPTASEFFAFKALSREFISKGATTMVTGVVDDEEGDDLDVDADAGETCRVTVERIVKKIKEACEKFGHIDEEFVVVKDVVSLADAESQTSVLARMDYAFKRFLWL